MQFQMVIRGEISMGAAGSACLSPEALTANLQAILELAKQEGLFTGDTEAELAALTHSIEVVEKSDGRVDLGIPDVYQGAYGWGFVGCESDDFKTELAARIAALQQVSAELEPHIAVEYDQQYSGGDYAGAGDVVFLPTKLLDALPASEGVDTVHACFALITGLPASCIVTYSPDTLYTRSGRFYRL